MKRKPNSECHRCKMYKFCQSPIMEGDGPEDAEIVFVGEAPGKTEDEEGLPFQGIAGDLLRAAMEEIGITKERFKIRITNAIRCRPEDNNLKKWPKAVDHCRGHILRELHQLKKAKVIVLMGNIAIQSILRRKGITKLNGEVFKGNGRYYVCSVHPAYVLRNPEAIKKLNEALLTAKRLATPKKSSAREYELVVVRDKKMLKEAVDVLKKQKEAATDIEASTLSPFSKMVKPRVGCVGWAWTERNAICFPVYARVGWENTIKVRPEEVLEAVKDVWESDLAHSLHNGKYDWTYVYIIHGILMKNYKHDTMLMSYTLDERPGIHGLKPLALGIGMGDYALEKVIYEREHPECNVDQGGNANNIIGDLLYPYNMLDCIATFKLKKKFYRKIKEKGLYENPYRFPIQYHNWTAAILEMAGIKLDMDYNGKLLTEFPEKIDEFDKKIMEHPAYIALTNRRLKELVKETVDRVKSYKRPPDDFKEKVTELVKSKLDRMKESGETLVNLNSPDDKRDLVFEELGYESTIETKGGLPSVKMKILEDLHNEAPHKILENIIKRSQYSSGYSKYVLPLRGWEGSDGRTHTNYLVHRQVTGRVASEEPNHENLPKRGPLAKLLRTQFTATNDDYTILEGDLKQNEFRLIADAAQDDVMIEELNAGKDPHTMGAAAAFEVPEEKVTKAMRTDSKSAVSFGLLYGRQAPALAGSFKKPVSWAVDFINRYFEKYDEVPIWWEKIEEFVRKHKYVRSHFGRIRHLPDVDSDSEARVAEAIRQAINSPIQGDSSDICWIAGYRLAQWLLRYRMKSKVIVVIHDDIKVDCYKKELPDVLERMHYFMTDRKILLEKLDWELTVPLDIDPAVGPDFGHTEELERKGDWFKIPAL